MFYRLNPAGIAAYPMYRGLATVAQMQIIPTGHTFADEVETLHQNYSEHDFFFIHYKPADAAGEDGNFDAKVKTLEDLDPFIPRIRELQPEVFHGGGRPLDAGHHGRPQLAPGSLYAPFQTDQGRGRQRI